MRGFLKAFATSTVAIGILAGSAMADGIAYWDQNDNGLPGGGFGFQPGDFPQPADYGAQAGSATLNIGGGITSETMVNGNGDTVYTWLQSFAGSTINAQYAEPSGGAISIQGGTDNANNGSYLDLDFNASTYQNVNLSLAGRRTGSGFSDIDVYAYDGATLLGVIAADVNMNTTTMELWSWDASLLDGVANAKVRFTFNGATGSTGNFRFDNLYLQGDLVPTPGAAALLGLGGLVATRRRRA